MTEQAARLQLLGASGKGSYAIASKHPRSPQGTPR